MWSASTRLLLLYPILLLVDFRLTSLRCSSRFHDSRACRYCAPVLLFLYDTNVLLVIGIPRLTGKFLHRASSFTGFLSRS